MPPYRRRQKSRAPLVVVAVIAFLAIVAGSGFYFLEYRPRTFVETWNRDFGYPDTLVVTQRFREGGRKLTMIVQQSCAPGYRGCNPGPAKDMSNWLSRGGLNMTEREAGECFRDGCQRVFFREGHKGLVEFEKVSPIGWNFQVKVVLSW